MSWGLRMSLRELFPSQVNTVSHRYVGKPQRPRQERVIHLVTNLHLHNYYVRRFNKLEHPDAAMLAMFYLFCALREGECQ